MSSWDEQIGILDRKDGFVVVGFHCSRCEAYWQMSMPQDDYNEATMKEELCYACSLRKRLASEIRHNRFTYRLAMKTIRSMEEQLNVLVSERDNHENLLQSGSRIIQEQDTTIRDLKKQLDKRAKKK